MLHATHYKLNAPRLLLATCISATLLLAGCTEDNSTQLSGNDQETMQASPNTGEAAQQKTQDKAEAQVKATALEPKIIALPDPGPAPDLSQYVDITQGNTTAFVFEALRGGAPSLDFLKMNLDSSGEVSELLEGLSSPDRFVSRDAHAKFDANIGALIDKHKDVRYIRLEVAEYLGSKLLKQYDFDRQGFEVDANGIFDGGEQRGWISGDSRGHRLLVKNGPEFKFISVTDEATARAIESIVTRGSLGDFRLVMYGYIDDLIEAPENREPSTQAWRGLDIKVQRIELANSQGNGKLQVLHTVEL